ncbi:MAG: hypothetical protein WDA72_10690 [Desulfomonilia bacterium]|nr:hypothetical protein [Deltaproteobacteria bacterium]
MARNVPTLIAALLVFLLPAGCSSLTSYTLMTQQARLSISQGRFDDALTAFPEKSARGKDEVLIRLERAVLLQAMGRFTESSREFQLAAGKIGQYESRAVVSAGRTASQAGSLILNEQVQPYEGEDFEKILLHAMNAVNYLMAGDLEGARVEIRVAYRRQNELREKRARELEKAEREGRAKSWEQSFQKADSGRYRELSSRAGNVHSVYQNAYAYYVSSLVYELGGELDEAYIDLKKGIQAAPDSESLQKDLIRLSRNLGFYEDEQKWVARYGEPDEEYGVGTDVFVIFQHGTAPVKEPLSFPIPLPGGGLAFASLPVYRFIPSGTQAGSIGVGGRDVRTSVVSDINAIAARNLLDEFPVLFAKQVARSILKAQMTSKLSREYGAMGAITGTLASAVTEQADQRTWVSLPKEIQAGRVFVPEHTGSLTVTSIPGGHTAVVDIPEGTRHLIILCRDTDAGLALQTKAY